MKWSYGVTTVLSRKDTTLPRTLHSMCDAGFGEPRLFVDNCTDPTLYDAYGLPITCHYPALKIVGNWLLSALELYIRNPLAHRYAIFQDDVLCVGNLRAYLEAREYPKKGYLNLYTFDSNRKHTKNKPGWHESNQNGLGALGLVFSNAALLALIADRGIITKPAAANKSKAWKSMDGGIVTVLKNNGYREYIHNPSLLQHIGTESSLGNGHFPPIASFPGEDYDAMQLLKDAPLEQPRPREANSRLDKVYEAIQLVGIEKRRVDELISDQEAPMRRQTIAKLHAWAVRVHAGKTEDAEKYFHLMVE